MWLNSIYLSPFWVPSHKNCLQTGNLDISKFFFRYLAYLWKISMNWGILGECLFLRCPLAPMSTTCWVSSYIASVWLPDCGRPKVISLPKFVCKRYHGFHPNILFAIESVSLRKLATLSLDLSLKKPQSTVCIWAIWEAVCRFVKHPDDCSSASHCECLPVTSSVTLGWECPGWAFYSSETVRYMLIAVFLQIWGQFVA